MTAHRLLVRMQAPDGSIRNPGEVIDYDGTPTWKLEPLDAKAREAWQAIAQPERVLMELRRTGFANHFAEGEQSLPPGGVSPQAGTLPPSGPHAVVFG
jgi:hypothetical protein